MAIDGVERAAPPGAPGRRRWPLIGVVWLDFAIIIAAVLALTSLIQIAFVGLGARQQGLSTEALSALESRELLRLIGPVGVFVSTLVQNLVFIGVPLLRLAVIRREPLDEFGLSARKPLLLLLYGLAAGIVIVTANVVISAAFVAGGMRQNQSAELSAFLSRGDVVGQLLFFVMAVVVAPIGEEVLFRGYVFNAIRRGSGQWRVPLAYALSAGIFASLHLLNVSEGAIALVVPLFVVGLLLAASAHLTGSIIPGIIAHAMNNSLGVAALLFCVNNPAFTGCPTV